MKELKVVVGFSNDNKVIYIEPVNQAAGKAVEAIIMTARLLTQDDIDREIKECMEEGRTYKRIGRRIREVR